jgi:hypothetical protein
MRSHVTTSPVAKDSMPLQRKAAPRIGEPDDAYEREADRMADTIIRGGTHRAGFSLSKISIAPPVQREGDGKPKSEEDKYKEAAKKLGEAFLETGPGKEIKQKAEKLGDAFISTLPGKIIAGSAITGAVAALAATHKELPIGIPEIPLDIIKPGLKMKITYEGPVDKPTKVMATFSIPLGPQRKSRKPKMSKSQQFRAETARMAEEQRQFRESLKTPQQRADDEAMVNAWVLSQVTAPGFPLSLGLSGPGLPPPLAPYATEFKITGEQPKTREPRKKKKEATVRRKATNSVQEPVAPAIVNDVLESSGQTLEPAARAFMESRFGHDFSQVRIHTDTLAAKSADSISASAYTAGNHIVFANGRYSPGSSEGQHLLAHELAHVVQQQAAGSLFSAIPMGALDDSAEHEAELISRAAVYGGTIFQPLVRRPLALMRQPQSLQTVPLAERRAIQVSTMAVSVPTSRIDAFFRLMPSGNPGERRSVGATNSFSTNIAATLHVGLGSVGAWIQGDTNALPLNSSIEVDLDLSNHGGSHSTYRFTYFAHTTGQGSRASTGNVMLIELVGNVVAAPSGQAAPTSTFSIGSTSFNLSGTWSDNHYAVLRQALSLLPASALADAAGVTFRKTSQSSSGGEAGNYDQTTDTISIHSNAFPSSSMRVGQRSHGVHNILHEIGHALDLRVLERAWNTFNSAGQTAAARQTFLQQRSPSGSRYVRDNNGDYNVEQNMADRGGAFRQAARKDQVRQDTSGRVTTEGTTATLQGGITSYSDTDYQELFAEAFAMYINAPETLRQLRPNIYAYFNSRYPRPGTP